MPAARTEPSAATRITFGSKATSSTAWGGKADVTADVNFTDVAAWAAEAGFGVSPLETQGAFLERHVKRAAARAAREPALAFLLDPRGAGSAFKALELRKG